MGLLSVEGMVSLEVPQYPEFYVSRLLLLLD